MNVRDLFEAELRKREITFLLDESGRHVIEVGGGQVTVSLENLQRDFQKHGDLEQISRFVDTVMATWDDKPLSRDRLYLCLEPNDYEVKADFRTTVSDRVDCVLVHLSEAGDGIAWVSPEMLESLGLSEPAARDIALDNLARELAQAKVEVADVHGVKLGYLTTTLPFKASLILAPNLLDVVGPTLGRPLLAVTPDRDFLYLWDAQHVEFAGHVGNVVVREYVNSSYPITTEVFKITEERIEAIGEFPVPEAQ